MLSRRKLLAGAATAAVVAPTAASALPARVLEKAPLPPPSLPGFLPCDGRELPICDYERLFEAVKHACSWSAHTQTFRVPDARALSKRYPVLANGAVLLEDVISTGHDPRVPAGVILLMEKAPNEADL